MQRFLQLLAFSFISLNCAAQQYPFIHYTQADGLISNNIKNIYQDHQGRLYFISFNGLSVYDGARFSNYSSENGLQHEIVNCVMDMGKDSIWVVTNSKTIYGLTRGRLKKLSLSDSLNIIIDYLLRDDQGTIYAGSEQGLYLLKQNRFFKLPLTDLNGKDINTYISHLFSVGNYLLIQRDNTLLPEEKYKLYLYDTKTKKVLAQSQNEIIYSVNKAPDGRIWIGTDKAILAIDTIELKKGKIVFKELESKYVSIKNSAGHSIFFDHDGNCWLTDRVSALKKVNIDGDFIAFTTASGLRTLDINQIFQDAEGTIWIATLSAGVDKLVYSNISFTAEPFGLSVVSHISYAEANNQLLLYSLRNSKFVTINANNHVQHFSMKSADPIQQMIETPKGFFGTSEKTIYSIYPAGKSFNTKPIFTAPLDNVVSGLITDRYGNLHIGGRYYLTTVIDGKTIHQKKINSFIDQIALDTNGNIWIAHRGSELIMFQIRPDDPVNYLEQKLLFTNELSGYSPRSITIDRDNVIWIGTRSNGIYAYQLENENLILRYHVTSSTGLTENFVNYLTIDRDNNIWACTPSGLDKISIQNGIPVVENLTKQYNIYQTYTKVVVDKNNTAWALFSNGLITIPPEIKKTTTYSPKLMLVTIKSGVDTLDVNGSTTLSHKQNNLNFYFAAPTYLDEKQVLYSYRLHGSNQAQWSEPSDMAHVSFISLHPGKYTLDAKAIFPAGKYPDLTIQHKFFITPPWWQATWFRFIAGVLIFGFMVLAIRFYYRRKLLTQSRALEKQQAIEKERTRIATDMHDDLGAGLSRIKFLTQSLRKKETNDESMKNGLEKITEYSDEMTEKMGEIVWALNEKNDTLADLVAYIRSYAVEYLANHNIECEANTPLHLPGTFIAGEIRRNIFLAVKECLHNIVKHAAASRVYLSIELNDKIRIVIHDNGKGIDWNNQRPNGIGLLNIRRRMHEIKGKADFITEQGTQVLLQVPINL